MFTSNDSTTTPWSRRLAIRAVAATALVAVLALGGVSLAATSSAHPASAATVQPRAIDAFIIFSANATGVTGEGLTGGPGNIEVNSFQWGVNMAVDTATGLPTGHVTYNPFSITRQIDKASPVFFRASAAGTILKQVTVFMTPSASSKSTNSMHVILYNVLVSSDTWNGVTNGTASTETIRMIARTYQIVYS